MGALLLLVFVWLGQTRAHAQTFYYDSDGIHIVWPADSVMGYENGTYTGGNQIAIAGNGFGGYSYLFQNGQGGAFSGNNWGGIHEYDESDDQGHPTGNLIVVDKYYPPPAVHDALDSILFAPTTGSNPGTYVGYGAASLAYAVTLGGATVRDTEIGNSTYAYLGDGNFGTISGFHLTLSLSGTYTASVGATFHAQQVDLTNSGTFTTPLLSLSGAVNVNGGGTLHGDQTVIDSTAPQDFYPMSNYGIDLTPLAGTTLTLSGGSTFEAPNYVEIGRSNDGAATLVLRDGAKGNVGSIFLGTGSTGSEGVLTLNSATLTATSFLQVGFGAGSKGTVNIQAGGQLTNTDAAIGFGGGGAVSSVTVDGQGSKWTNKGFLEVGANGSATATLTVRNGGAVTSEGYLVVGGVTGNTTGNGSLFIQSGGQVTSGTTLSGATLAAAVGFGDNSAGTATIDGSGSLWDIKARLNVGYGAGSVGTVTVSNGGTLQVEGDTVRLGRDAAGSGTLTFDKAGGASPTLTFGTGTSSQLLIGDAGTGNFSVQGGAGITANASVVLGNAMNSLGTATVQDAGSSWHINGNLNVGLNGVGHLTVQDGDAVTVDGTGVLGQEHGSKGTVTLDGTGTMLTFTNPSNQLEIGRHGSGVLELTGGASLSLPTTQLGSETDGHGNILISGKNLTGGQASMLTVDSLTIGYASGATETGNGLTISGGGQVMIKSGVEIAYLPNSAGFLQLTGLNSRLQVTSTLPQYGDVVVGLGGTGTFEVSDQASFTVGKIDLGFNGSDGTGPGSTGTVNVLGSSGTGNQTLFTANGTMRIGYNGVGHFNASGGAQVATTSDVILAAGKGNAISTIMLTDPKTTWSAAGGGTLTIGQVGDGLMTVQNGATFTAGSTVKLGDQDGSTGVLTVTGDGATFTGRPTLMMGGDHSTLNVQAGGQVMLNRLDPGVNTANVIFVDGKSSTGTPSTLNVQSFAAGLPSMSLNVTVSGGGNLTVTGGSTIIVDSSGGGPALFNVTGTGSQFTASNAQIGFGNVYSATAGISGGGLLATATGSVGNGSGPTTVTVGGNGGGTWNLGSDDISGDLYIGNNGTLKLGDNGIVNAAGILQQNQGGVITVNGAGAALNANSINGSTFAGQFDVMQGTVNVQRQATITGTLTMTGTHSTLMSPNLGIFNGGSVTMNSDAAAILSHSVTVGGGSTLDLTGGGRMNIGLYTPGVVTQAGDGEIFIGVGGKLIVNGTVNVRALGTGQPDLLINPLGTLGGSGTVNGRVVNSGGKVAPGDPQTLTINGDYVQTNGGLLQIAIAGTAAAQMDHLVITGQTTLSGGQLELDFIAGFAPKTGDIFNFLSSASLDPNNHTFDSVDITGLAPGFQYNVQIDPNNPGNYELMALNNGVATSVPEPGVWMLLLAGAVGLGLIARRRRAL